MFYLSKIINKSLVEERCFLSTHDITCYEFINCGIKINNKYFIVENIGIYTNLKINFDYFEDLIDIIHNITDELEKINNDKFVLIDYFGVNFGKVVHFGHLRTLIYGTLIKKLYKYVGINIKSDTHFGDSHIHIAKYINWLLNNNYDLNMINSLNIYDLNNIYIQASEKDEDASNSNKISDILSRINTVGTYESIVREKIVNESLKYIKLILKKLNIKFDFMYSESRYYDLCSFLVKFGLENNLFEFDKSNRLVTDNKIVLTNSNMSFLYAFVDIATIVERNLMNASKIIYVVDKRQSFYFSLIFNFTKKLFNIDLVHIKYGYVYNKNNQIISSRHMVNTDILSFMEYFENKGYSIKHIRLALYLYEIKHRMQSDYLFLEDVFIDILNSSKIIYKKFDDIENIFIKKENTKCILSNLEKNILTKFVQLYESVHICIEDNILDRFCFTINELKSLILKLDIDNVSFIFSKYFLKTIKLFNFVLFNS